MADVWKDMSYYRERGDWRMYWAARRVWVAAARLHGVLYAQEHQQTEEQRALFDVNAYRPHDSAA